MIRREVFDNGLAMSFSEHAHTFEYTRAHTHTYTQGRKSLFHKLAEFVHYVFLSFNERHRQQRITISATCSNWLIDIITSRPRRCSLPKFCLIYVVSRIITRLIACCVRICFLTAINLSFILYLIQPQALRYHPLFSPPPCRLK